jgi:hypothetical protein
VHSEVHNEGTWFWPNRVAEYLADPAAPSQNSADPAVPQPPPAPPETPQPPAAPAEQPAAPSPGMEGVTGSGQGASPS